jgi:GNAT superfamily N-acetyltransferase
MKYEIIEKLPSAEEYNHLRQLVGWSVYDPEVIVSALPQTLYCVCALMNEDIIGMARVIGDGGLVYYIQDVIVHPDYQRQGIGAKMMDRVMVYIGGHASQNSIVGLMSAYGKESFYEKYGFTRRPTERLGCGMTLFWEIPQAKQ